MKTLIRLTLLLSCLLAHSRGFSAASVIRFSSASYMVNENGIRAELVVRRSGNTNEAATVEFATSNKTAIADSDYVAQNGTLTFAPGETTRSIFIPILDDTLVEPTETFGVALSSPVGAVLGSPNKTLVLIKDNDSTVQFTAASSSVSEASPFATITARRTGVLTTAATVEFSTSDGTATAGLDYGATNGVLTFPPGVTTRSFRVPIVRDTIDETNETVNLTLSNPTGAMTLGNVSNAVLSIIDNDAGGIIQFSHANFSSSETKSNALVLVVRTGGVASGVTVDFFTGDGTGKAGTDYAALAGTIAFPAGVSQGNVSIPTYNDADSRSNKTAFLFLRNATGGANLGANSNATLTIVNTTKASTGGTGGLCNNSSIAVTLSDASGANAIMTPFTDTYADAVFPNNALVFSGTSIPCQILNPPNRGIAFGVSFSSAITAGQSFAMGFPNGQPSDNYVEYHEDNFINPSAQKRWRSDRSSGTLTINSITDTSINFTVTGVRVTAEAYAAQNGQADAATGSFTLNFSGTIFRHAH